MTAWTGSAGAMRPGDPGALPTPVLVVGTGLMGASVGLALGRAGVVAHLRDHDARHVEGARSVGAGTVRPPGDVGLVVVAVPPDALGTAVVEALREWPQAVVTDIGSVKAAPLSAVAAAGEDSARYVGSHPMAGSERSGPWAASADLFDGRAWAVTPHQRSAPTAAAAVRALATTCGATVVELSPADHDAAVARISHLPHLMAALVAGSLLGCPPEHLALAGQGLRDITRVAAGDPALWRQIVAANAGQLRGLLESVRAQLDALLTGLAGDSVLETLLQRGVDGTRLIPGKHGARDPLQSVLYVAVPDAPGRLAQLFADAGQSGVNVEDLRIDHDPTRPVGLVEIVVTATSAPTLARSLAERGWSVHS